MKISSNSSPPNRFSEVVSNMVEGSFKGMSTLSKLNTINNFASTAPNARDDGDNPLKRQLSMVDVQSNNDTTTNRSHLS